MEIFAVITPTHVPSWMPWAWLYIGPDVFLPLASAVAAVTGVLLMFWRSVVGIVGRVFGRSAKRGE
jgi:hypothetical protein